MARSLNSQSGRDDEPVDDNSRLRALNLGARAGRYCHGYKAQRGDEARHYDRAHALHRAIENRTLDTETALEPSTNAGHHDETVQDSNTAQADESHAAETENGSPRGAMANTPPTSATGTAVHTVNARRRLSSAKYRTSSTSARRTGTTSDSRRVAS